MHNVRSEKTNSVTTEITVGANECRLSIKGERLVTRRAFADVVVAMHAPSIRFAGLLRFSLSSAASRTEWEALKKFLDAAVATTIDGLKSMHIDFKDLSVYLIGGAHSPSTKALPPGKRLALAARRTLWQQGIVAKGEDLGGHQARGIWLDGASGRLIVRSYAMPDDNPAFPNHLAESNPLSSRLDQLAC